VAFTEVLTKVIFLPPLPEGITGVHHWLFKVLCVVPAHEVSY
jgi:hypothetical protein